MPTQKETISLKLKIKDLSEQDSNRSFFSASRTNHKSHDNTFDTDLGFSIKKSDKRWHRFETIFKNPQPLEHYTIQNAIL